MVGQLYFLGTCIVCLRTFCAFSPANEGKSKNKKKEKKRLKKLNTHVDHSATNLDVHFFDSGNLDILSHPVTPCHHAFSHL